MSLPILVGSSRTLVPDTYSTFKVEGSLPSPAPAARNIYIIGEAEEGVPGAELDLKGLFFQDFESVKEFYRSGPIVDAARMLFSGQPSAVFGGSLSRLYVYKTNASTRAEKVIASPANYGKLVAARYGERGNLIKSQIITGQAETKPSKTFLYAPSTASARDFKVAVNGAVSGPLTVSAGGDPAAFVAAMSFAGLSATGGAAKAVNTASITVTITASGDNLTLTKTGGAGDFGTNGAVGDSVSISPGLAVAGSSNENAGSYSVVSWSPTSITLRQLKRATAAGEVNVVAFFTGTGVSIGVGDIDLYEPVTLSVTATTPVGAGATLEVLGSGGDEFAIGNLQRETDLVEIISKSTAAVASVSASVPAAGKLAVTITSGSFSTIPKAGDLIRIRRGSLLQGATLKNVGLMVVETASSQSITMKHLYTGMTTEAVAQVNLAGASNALLYAPGFVSSAVSARRIDSSAERKVKLEASRSTDGESVPTTLIGGEPVLELSYYHAAATAATVSIDAQRVMTITPTGPSLPVIKVKLNKYKTMQDVVDFLNTQAGVSARIADNRFKGLSTKVLDMVSSVGCLQGIGTAAAYNARLKKDYYDWKQFFENNLSLIDFEEGTMVLKAGLPDAESAPGFLSGAAVGATSMASIQAALDEGLKISARIVIPLFSRDASLDIDDALTDENSSYTIDAINAAVKAHVATASSDLNKKYRFGYVSFDGSFADALQKVGDMAYERIKMGFQRVTASNANGELLKFLPWMEMCAIAAGRVQARLGVSLLRKPFLFSATEHVGALSLFTDTLAQDFDPNDRGELETAIGAGLVVMREVEGFGVRMESPDLTSRSRENDPEGWVYEREAVLAVCDDFRDTLQSVLDNFIGNNPIESPLAIIGESISNVIRAYVQAGTLLSGTLVKLERPGNVIKAKVSIQPPEAIEAIVVDVVAERSIET